MGPLQNAIIRYSATIYVKTMALQLGQPEMWYFGGDIGGNSPELEELRNSLSSESNGVPECNRGR
jgi:hypothetical protein